MVDVLVDDVQPTSIPTANNWSEVLHPRDHGRFTAGAGEEVARHHQQTQNTRWQFASDPEALDAFQAWLRAQLEDLAQGQEEEDAWDAYIQSGWKKGAGRAWDDASPYAAGYAADQSTADFYAGTKEQFMRSAFGQPVAVEKVQLLAARAFDELENVTADMANKISRVLTDGLVEGMSPRDIASEMVDQVDISRARALLVAQTEIIRAHAEGQLTALEQLGVTEVGVAVEWSTTGDEKVCDQCEPLEGVVLSIDEARGMLPRHPGCRCAWIPANVGEDPEEEGREQIDTKGGIEDALDESGFDEDEIDDMEITKKRPQQAFNALNQFSRLMKEDH